MDVFSLLIGVAFAAEGFLAIDTKNVARPAVSFGQLVEQNLPPPSHQGQVLGTGTFQASIVAGEVPVQSTPQTKKSMETIVFLGDSMIDTLGTDLRLVDDELRRVYPATRFTLLNYGVGGENIISGLERITRDTEYLGHLRPAIVSLKPDVIVIESFGYNPFPFETGALDQHWLSLAAIITTIRTTLPETKVVIAVTIAPNAQIFGDGAPGLSFSADEKKQRTAVIKQYLENAVRFAGSEHLPLADAYHPSMAQNGEGNPVYINPGDHIHYSDLGRQFFARTVAETIISNKLLEE